MFSKQAGKTHLNLRLRWRGFVIRAKHNIKARITNSRQQGFCPADRVPQI